MRLSAADQRTSRRAKGLTFALAVVVLALCLRVMPVAAAEPAAPAKSATPTAISAAPIPNAATRGGILSLGGLFDPSRLIWRQSLTFGVSSGGGYGGTAGLYTSSFAYRLANPLNLRVDVGAHLTPGFRGAGQTQGIFLQGMSLDWRPTKGSVIRFVYQDRRSPLLWGIDPAYEYDYYRRSPFGPPLTPSDPASLN